MSKPRVVILRNEVNSRFLWDLLKNWKQLADAGKPLAVHVDEHGERRSGAQNRLLWAILNDIAAQAWVGGKQYSADAWHEHFKREFLGLEELPNGQTIGISTATLKTSEFADYVTRVQQYAVTELGVELTF